MKFQEPIDLGKLISRLSEVTLIPIIEELFYRGTIPLDSNNTYFFIVFSILMFNISHYIGGLKNISKHIILI
ncbi:hypothetical protein RPL90_07930, partial [Staphylococcus kloosii]|nr:hypothetical protein [Staphylococcus kloosii]